MDDKRVLSYASTPASVPYMYMTVADRLRQLASEKPDKEAFIFYTNDKKRVSITRKQLLDKVENAARKLVTFGLSKGSTVAFCMTNSIEMLVMNLAVVLAGGVPFFFAANLKDGSDLNDFINGLSGCILIIDANVGDDNWKILNRVWPAPADIAQKVPCLKLILCNGVDIHESTYLKKLSTFLEGEFHAELPKLEPEDLLAYFCTSGSTGKPKHVIYSHFGALNWTKMSNIAMGIQEDSVFFCDRTFGWVVGYPRTYLTEGTCRVFVDTKLSMAGKHTEYLCEIIQNEKCDIVFLPGYITADILKNPQLSSKFKNVRLIILSGERILSQTYTALSENICNNVVVWYGNTETGGVALFSDSKRFQDGIIGRPLQGVELKIVDESGNVVPEETQGELCIRTNWRFCGYKNMDAMFREKVDQTGWFHTGDIAHMRKDGNFIVDGRYQEVISTGIMKFFPWSIEQTLKNLKGAEHVFAVGVPDPRLHQVVCACVVPKMGIKITESDVEKFCDESFLDISATGVVKKPRYFLILDKVPINTAGKIDRRTIGMIAKDKLGL